MIEIGSVLVQNGAWAEVEFVEFIFRRRQDKTDTQGICIIKLYCKVL